jgi:hypothetical protein
MKIDVRLSRTAGNQISDIEDADAMFEAWNELRMLQHGDVTPRCPVGQFADHWCPSHRLGFRVSRPEPRILLVWRLITQ